MMDVALHLSTIQILWGINLKNYKYLLSYGFQKKELYSDHQYVSGGTGRITMDLSRKIKTINDIYEVEKLIKKEVEGQIDNLESIALYSFSLLHWWIHSFIGEYMGKAKRKMRPQPPWWWTLDNDNCWFCKNRNNCGSCKLLKQQRAKDKKKYEKFS